MKLTHEKYQEKVNKTKFKLLEQYIDSGTPIKHLCFCGNEWYMKPGAILQTKSCGCVRKTTSNSYKEKLKHKGIKVQLCDGEIYKGRDTKLLHLCTCGNKWMVTPGSVVRNCKCGCGYRNMDNKIEFYKDKQTVLYYIKIGELFKIGITTYAKSKEISIRNRYRKDIKLGLEYEIIDSKLFNDGSKAYQMEQKILEEYKAKQYIGEKILISGNTELFSENILSKFKI